MDMVFQNLAQIADRPATINYTFRLNSPPIWIVLVSSRRPISLFISFRDCVAVNRKAKTQVLTTIVVDSFAKPSFSGAAHASIQQDLWVSLQSFTVHAAHHCRNAIQLISRLSGCHNFHSNFLDAVA